MSSYGLKYSKYYMEINKDSIGPYIVSVIVLIFVAAGLLYYFFIDKRRIILIFSAFQLSLFLYLFGYANYANSLNITKVLFWTRICYSGAALVPITFHYFVKEVIMNRHMKIGRIRQIFSIVSLILIWFNNEYLITDELRIKTHPTMIKGNLFVVFFVFLILLTFHSLYHLINKITKDKDFRRITWPLSVGIFMVALNSLYAGLFAAILGVSRPYLEVSFAIMVLMMFIYLALQEQQTRILLEKTVEEKNNIYSRLIKDSLTNLYSRNYFLDRLEELRKNIKNNIQSVVMFIDLDNFKLINDKFGHAVGDKVLKATSDIFNMDWGKEFVPARFGGDEFLLLFLDTTEEEAIKIAKDMQNKYLEKLQRILDNDLENKYGLSIGIVSSVYWKSTTLDIITQADEAMYSSKNRSVNEVSVYR